MAVMSLVGSAYVGAILAYLFISAWLGYFWATVNQTVNHEPPLPILRALMLACVAGAALGVVCWVSWKRWPTDPSRYHGGPTVLWFAIGGAALAEFAFSFAVWLGVLGRPTDPLPATIAVPAAGGLLGLIVMAFWIRPRETNPKPPRSSSPLTQLDQTLDNVANGGRRLGSIVGGFLMWIIAASLLFAVLAFGVNPLTWSVDLSGMSYWDNLAVTLGAKAIEIAAVLAAVVFFWGGLRQIVRALASRSPLVDQKAHGSARTANRTEAHTGARGGTLSPAHDQTFSD
jgi:hypothetical protein